MLTCATSALFGQQKPDATKLATEGIRLVDEGNFKDGIKLLQEARNQQPAEYDYSLEIAKAYLKSGDAKKAERYLYDLQYHHSVQPELFILLSECYAKVEEGKKNQDEARKKEVDALLYGIAKFPASGDLYLRLGHIYQQQEKPVDALAVWEKGIKQAPNFAENYYWTARMLQLTGNHLWAWIYGEVFWNMTEDPELGRAISHVIISSSEKVLGGQWVADPEKADQDFHFLLNEKCKTNAKEIAGINRQDNARSCILDNRSSVPTALIPFFDRLFEIRQRGWQLIYIAHLYQQNDREQFVLIATQDAEATDAFRQWFYWNRLKPMQPITRLN